MLFYFTTKALFVLKLIKFQSRLFGQVVKRADQKDKVDFKFYDATTWLTNSCNTHIVQYLKKEIQSDNEIQKDKVDFKFYDATAWLTNSCNTHIVQYLKKEMQSDNEICSVNRM